MTPTPAQAIEITVAKFVTRPESERLEIIENVRFQAGEADGVGHPERHQKEFSKALLIRLEQANKALTPAETPPALPTWKETAQVAAWIIKPVAVLAVLAGGVALFIAFIEGAMVAVRLWAVQNAGLVGAAVGGVLVAVLASGLQNPFRKQEEESEPGEVEAKNQTIINIYSANGGDVTVNEK